MMDKQIVIVMIGILSAIAIPTYLGIIKKFAPLCRGESCINRDPREQKCDKDARTIDLSLLPDGTKLELRFSGRCNAAWAKAEVQYGSMAIGSMLYVEDFQGNKYGLYTVESDGINQHYGSMGPGSNLKACVKLPSGEAMCTNDD